ncbi:MAG TPA: Ig-like domain-containing protein [Gemmatimonadales bacterium]|nr:Ig-like domain-containing protein [Gemmatimonadales bacterium]
MSRKLVPILATLAILPLASCSDDRSLMQPPGGTRYTTPTGLVTANPPQILVGAGDISECGTNNNDEATAQLLDGIPGTVFTAGDNVMPNGTTSEFANCYDPTWGRHKARTKPAAGNHDYNTSGGAGYFAYFGTAAGEPGNGYYSYGLGAWHIVVLNSNIPTTAGSAQDTWLKADLAAHPNQCTLAYYHHPLYSSTGGTGTGGATYSGVRNLFDVLYAAHADVVMGGHRHIYERIAPMTPNGTADPALGLRQFIVGTGGDGGGTLTNIFPLSEVRNGSTFGVLKLYLYDDSYAWKFVPVAGKTFTDSGSTACHFSGGGGGGVSATTSTVLAAPASFIAGSGASTITVAAKDANGNPVAGASVILAASGSGNILTPTSGTTDGNGVFTSILTSTVAEEKIVSATIDGTPINQTASVTVSPPDGGGGSGAITQTLLASGSNRANQRVYTTASISPAPNALITVAVRSRRSGGALTPTVTGGGMTTWTQVASVDYDVVTAPLARLVVFRAMSAAPGSGPITITFSNSVSNADWVVSQWTGVDLSGANGSGAIGQTRSARGNAVSALSSDLTPFGNARNVALGLLGAATNGPAASPGAGFTEIAEPSSGENTLLEAEWGVNLHAVTASLGKAVNAGLLAVELRAGAGGGQAVSAALSAVSGVSPITAGGTASTITVTARDASGDPISGATVVLAASGSGNTLTQPSIATDGNGVTTGSLSSTVAEVKDVSATINGVAITQHAAVTVNPAASSVSASVSAVGVSPASFTAGGGSTVTVTVRDGGGNPMSGVAVTLAISGSGNTITQPPVSDANGLATGSFNSTGAGIHTVTAVAGGVTLTQQPVVTVSAGPADAVRSMVTAQPTSIVQGSGSSTITVTARDAFGNPVSGSLVELHTSGTGNTLTGGGTTNASGVASGTLSSTVAEAKMVSATAGGVAIAQTATVTVTPTPPGGGGAIAHTLLTSGHDPNNVRVYTTGSIAPAGNALVIVAVLTHQSSAAAPSPTLSGGGMARWDVVASVAYNGATPLDRLTVYRAMSVAPGSGPITISSSVTVSNCQWIVSQWTGVDDAGDNGAGAIVQTGQTSGTAVNGLTVMLAPFAGLNDVAYGAFGVASATAIVAPGSGFTAIDQQPSGEGTIGDLFAEWAPSVPAITATWAARTGAAIGLEIKAKLSQ